MKGVILAGGLGTRMDSATRYFNKHTYPVGCLPLVCHSIKALAQAGVNDILILSNGENRGQFLNTLGTGEEWGVNLFYRGEREVKGSGQTILMAESFVGKGESFIIMHGDSVFFSPLPWLRDKKAPHLFVMPTPDEEFDDARKYGQVQLSARDGVVALKEGVGRREFSSFIQIAVWIFTGDAFNAIRGLQREHDGEVRTAEIVQEYIKDRRHRPVNYTMLPARSYIDCGTWSAMRKAEELLGEQAQREQQSVAAVN